MKPLFVVSIALSIGITLAILEGASEADDIDPRNVQDDPARSEFSPHDGSVLPAPAALDAYFLVKSVKGSSSDQLGVHRGGTLPDKYLKCQYCEDCINSVFGIIAYPPCWTYASKCGGGLTCACCSKLSD